MSNEEKREKGKYSSNESVSVRSSNEKEKLKQKERGKGNHRKRDSPVTLRFLRAHANLRFW